MHLTISMTTVESHPSEQIEWRQTAIAGPGHSAPSKQDVPRPSIASSNHDLSSSHQCMNAAIDRPYRGVPKSLLQDPSLYTTTPRPYT